MKATCPTSPNHMKFITSATILQDWFVDEGGNFIEEADDCTGVLHFPDRDNVWTCNDCGETAELN